MPPAEGETGGQVLGSKVVTSLMKPPAQNAAVKRIVLFDGAKRGRRSGNAGANRRHGAAGGVDLYPRLCRFRFWWRLAAGVVIALAHDVIITLGILSLFPYRITAYTHTHTA